MNETMFLSDLRSRLTAQGVSEFDADKYADQFKRYFDNLNEDEIAEQIASLGSMDGIVSNLLALIEAKREKGNIHQQDMKSGDVSYADRSEELEKTLEVGISYDETGDADESGQDSEIITENGEEALGKPKKGETQVTASEEIIADSSAPLENNESITTDDEFIKEPRNTSQSASAYDIAADDNRAPRIIRGNTKVGLRFDSYVAEPEKSNYENNDGFSPEAYNAAYNAVHSDDEYIIESETRTYDGTRRYLSTKKGRLPAKAVRSEYYDDYDDYYDDYDEDRSNIRKYIYKGPKREWAAITSERGKKRFWGILLGTLPITIPIAALIVILFSAAFLALWVVIAALVLLLAAITVVGSAFSLIAIIYGITQLFTAAPIGLYEIGIGIASAGITMLMGILVYNADVRAMPYAIKYLIKFFFFSIDRLKGLVYRFREECAKIK